jgi:tetratricopeptide (TPR) repeat protein
MSQDKIRALLAANDYTLLGSLYEDITGLKAPGDVARAKPGQGHFYVDLTTRLFAVLWFAEQCRLLENLVCIEWGYCKRRAVLLVRLGLSAFCGCDGQKTYKEQVDKLIATWAAKASGKAPGHENSYDRDWYRAYVWLGDRFFDRGQYSKAAVYFQEALRAGGERAASDSRLLNQAAWTLCEIGRPAEAVEYAEEAANLEPNDDAILDTLGIVYFGCRDFERSIQVLERSIVVGRASGPTWDWSDGAQENRFHLVRSYVSAERLADARRVLQDMNKVARGSTWTQQAEELIKEQTNIDL